MIQSPAPSPLGHRFQDFQTTSLVELSASLLKIVAIAALVFGVILGAKQWIFIGIASGILSATLYAYSQSGTDESWSDWIGRMVFSVRHEPPSPRTPERKTEERRSRIPTPKRTPLRKINRRTISEGGSPSHHLVQFDIGSPGRDAILSPVPERSSMPNSPALVPIQPPPLGIYVPHEDAPGVLEARVLGRDEH